MYHECYKCGKTLDDYPSHLCAECRAAIFPKGVDLVDPIKALAVRLTADDITWLRGINIRVDADMWSTK